VAGFGSAALDPLLRFKGHHVTRRIGGFEAVGSTSDSFSEKLKEHDRGAWRHLLDAYGSVLFARYVQVGVSPDEADELTMEVLAEVVRCIPRYRHGSFRGWLWTLANRKLLDHFRRSHRQRDRADGGSEAAERLAQLASREDWQAKEDALFAHEMLSRMCELRGWSTLERTKVWDYLSGSISGSQAARDCRLSAAAFYQRISRLMSDLRQAIGRDTA
jgi:DNA-directed RNA polymerase specialized sigma24 family protein